MAPPPPSRPDHYAVLGIDRSATADEIRRAYRDRARQYHPDRGRPDDDAMAAVNAAYEVLADPARRAVYDGGRRAPTPSPTSTRHPDPDVEREMQLRRDRTAASGPARIPWRFMAVAAVLGSAAVLIGSFFVDPPAEEPPDGILRIGSCVAFEPNGDAREVACTGEDDRVVALLVPLDAECPAGLDAHRDRLGLVRACLEPVS